MGGMRAQALRPPLSGAVKLWRQWNEHIRGRDPHPSTLLAWWRARRGWIGLDVG